MKKVTSQDGTQIAYDKRGAGPVVILVLGALNKRGSGDKLAKLLSGDLTVVTYDRRGRGDSTDTAPYSVAGEIADLEALIDELGGSACLYGHSSGAVLALAAAQALGTKVTGLMLYEVPYNDDAEALESAKSYRLNLGRALADGDMDKAVELFVSSVGVTPKQIAAMQRLPLWRSLTAMAPTLAYDTIEIMEYYPTINVPAVTIRTLVMYGGASPEFMGRTAQQLAAKLPQAQLEPVEGQTHDVKADILAPVLTSFMSKQV